MSTELIQQLLELKSKEEFSQWINEHISELDDNFFQTLESDIAQISNDNPQQAQYLGQAHLILKKAVSQSSGTPSSPLPPSITQLINEFQSGKIDRSEALKKAERIRLSDGEAFASGDYLEQISQQKPLPQIAFFLADVFFIAANKVKDRTSKGMLIYVCTNIFRENFQAMPKAIEAYIKALEIFDRLEDRHFVGNIQNNLGTAYSDLQTEDQSENLKNAIECYKKALKIRTKTDFPVEYAMTQNNLGNAYRNLPSGNRCENLQKAIICYQQALESFTIADLPIQYATSQNNLGVAYSELPTDNRGENLKNAIECYKQALEIRTKADFPVQYANTQNNLGNAYSEFPSGDRGKNLQKAITCYEQALEIYDKTDFPVQYANAQNNLGNAYSEFPSGDRGKNLQKTITCYEQALEIYDKTDFPVQYAITRNNLGTAYSDLPTGIRGKNLQKAIVYYQQALEIRTKSEFPTEYAITQNNLGNAYWGLPTGDRGENLHKAIECYKQALGIKTKEDFPVQYADTQNNLGNVYWDLPTGDRGENLHKAIECYKQALEIRTKANFPVEYADTQNNLGNVYSNLPTGDRGENLHKAIECYKQALEIRTKANFPVEYAMTQNNLGTAYWNLPTGDRENNLRKAIQCYQEALEKRKQQKLWEDILKKSINFIRLYFAEKDWEKVLDFSQDTIGIYNEYWGLIFLSESKKALSNLVFEIFRILSYALFQKRRFLDAVAILDEGSSRHLSETLKMGQELPEDMPEPIRKKALLLYQEVQELQSGLGKADQIETYKEKLQEFKELMKPYRPKRTGTLRDFIPQLKQEKSALLYLNVTSHGGFYALVHDTNPGEKDMLLLTKIGDDTVEEFYWNEKDGWFTLYNQDRLDELGKLFEQTEGKIQNFANQSEFNKILQRIEELGIKKLVILPQGILHTFPFGGIKEIPENLEICFAPNAQLLLNSYQSTCVTDRNQMSFTGFANPCEDKRLFFTNAEMAYISSLIHSNKNLNAQIHWGREGTKQVIFEEGKKSTFLHFSTHGLYDPKDVENSCLFLFKDQLHLRDIYQLKFPSCFMVGMSACETGIPDLKSPGEYACLSAGFHQAGAKVVVSTLWSVFDLSTSLLMGEFYRCFLHDGLSPAYAMRQAQKWLKESSPVLIVDRLKEYRAILKVEKGKLSSLEEPWIDSQINIIRGSLIAIESQINKLRETKIPPFQNPYYWAGFIVNGWGF